MSSLNGLPRRRRKETEQDCVSWLRVGTVPLDALRTRQKQCSFSKKRQLGYAEAELCYGLFGFDESSRQRYCWWGRAAAKGDVNARNRMAEAALKQLKLSDDGKGSGPALFEIGVACKGHLGDGEAFGGEMRADFFNALKRAVALHDEWCEDARRAVFCWMLCSRQLGVAKDLRLLIARALWAKRVAWIPKVEMQGTLS